MSALKFLHRFDVGLFVFLTLLFTGCGGGGGGAGGGINTTSPTVTSTTPVDNATSVPVNTNVTATFSEAMDASTINATNFTLKDSNNVAVLGTVAASGVTATLTPSALSSNTSYTATITTGVKDLAGNAMGSNKSWSFTTGSPVFAGFDFSLKQQDFWRFNWKSNTSSFSTGGSSSSSDAGRYWVVLGAPATIQGVNAYAVQLFGRTSWAPRWKYLAISNEQLLGSTDGITLSPFFDAQIGKWPGGGFFLTLSSSTLTVANNGTPNSKDTWISGSPAIVTGSSGSSGECQYFPGVGTICGSSSSSSYTEQEYFRPSFGPVGLYRFGAFSSQTGSSSSETDIGLTASSLNGDAYPIVSESEPNDSSSQAQTITVANLIVGTAAPGDTGTMTQVPVGTVVYSVLMQDWYKLVVPAAGPVKIILDFENSPNSDLDLYLFDASLKLIDYSANDNLTSKQWNETISNSNLPAGTYYITVNAFATPSGVAATYTLDAGAGQ